MRTFDEDELLPALDSISEELYEYIWRRVTVSSHRAHFGLREEVDGLITDAMVKIHQGDRRWPPEGYQGRPTIKFFIAFWCETVSSLASNEWKKRKRHLQFPDGEPTAALAAGLETLGSATLRRGGADGASIEQRIFIEELRRVLEDLFRNDEEVRTLLRIYYDDPTIVSKRGEVARKAGWSYEKLGNVIKRFKRKVRDSFQGEKSNVAAERSRPREAGGA